MQQGNYPSDLDDEQVKSTLEIKNETGGKEMNTVPSEMGSTAEPTNSSSGHVPVEVGPKHRNPMWKVTWAEFNKEEDPESDDNEDEDSWYQYTEPPDNESEDTPIHPVGHISPQAVKPALKKLASVAQKKCR